MRLRPSGQLGWLLNRLEPDRWDVVGCVSSEARWSTAWECAAPKRRGQHYLDVRDAVPETDPDLVREYEQRLLRQVVSAEHAPGFDSRGLVEVELLARNPRVVATAESICADAGPNVILDVSCMPKRYLFPLLKTLLDDRTIANLVIAYTFPQTHGAALGCSPDEWAPLPLFGKAVEREPLILVGVGYEPLGLAQILSAMPKSDSELRFIVPVGTAPTSARRSWEFLHHVWPELQPHWQRPPLRVDVQDISGAFDLLASALDDRNRNVVLAPFGPKTLSVAMGLFACQLPRATVVYTQPSYYGDGYSTGVLPLPSGDPACIGYCIRMDGTDAYRLDGRLAGP